MTPSDFLDSDYADLLLSRLLVPHYLIHCFLYYDLDRPIIDDSTFDYIARRLDNEWNDVEHRHKHLIDRSALKSGGNYLSRKFPAMVMSSAWSIVNEIDAMKRLE